MKKILSLLLAVIMVASLLPVMALAEIGGKDNNDNNITESPFEGNAKYVSANASGDQLTVNGDVTGEDDFDSISASDGAEIIVTGTVTNNIENNESSAVSASSGAKVSTGNVIAGNGNLAIHALGEETTVTAEGVEESGDIYAAIYAQGGATVTVNGSVTENDAGDAINAEGGATVEVGSVSEDGKGNGVSASSGASVTVEGNVTESGDGFAVNATDAGTMVTVNGNVDESGSGSALQAVKATIIVIGNVEEKNAGTAITAAQNATVIVGGNVTDGVETYGASDAVFSGYGATVIVEGLVTGQLNTNGQTNSGTIYLGKLNGNIKEDADLSKIHYLIGTAADSPVKLSNVTLESEIVADGTIDGVNEEDYRYTTTADATALNGKTITLKPANGKKLTVSGFDGADVTYKENVDGSVTFTIGENFTGGLQNLVLKLTDKQVPEEPVRRHKNTTTVTIGDRDDKEKTKAEETSEENPNTGAPVMDFGAVAVVLGAAYVVFKKH